MNNLADDLVRVIFSGDEIAQFQGRRINSQMYSNGDIYITCQKFGDVMSIAPDDARSLAEFILANQSKTK